MLLETGANPNLQLKRRPPYRDVPQDRGGDTILAQGATPLLRAARAGDAPFVAAAAQAQCARRSAEQGRRHAADGGGRRRIRHTRDARTQSYRRGRARDDAAAARRGRRHQCAGWWSSRGATRPMACRRLRSSPSPFAPQSDSECVGRAAPDGAARRGRARLHAVREIPGRERGGSAREGCKRQNGARSRERCRRPGCSSGSGEGFPETVALIESLIAAKATVSKNRHQGR